MGNGSTNTTTNTTTTTFPPIMGNDLVTEDSAALRFIELHGDELRFCHSRARWLRWNGQYWEVNTTRLAYQWARELTRQLASDQGKSGRCKLETTKFATGVEVFSRCDPRVARTANDFDRDPWLLGTPGGTVDLRTGQLRPSRPDDMISKATLVAPDGSAFALWLKFLDEATGSDAELIRFLQLWCGYCLTGITREHALVFVYGGGGNGKGVFLNTISSLLKDYATTSAMETFVASNSDKHPTDLAMLAGARLVTASETEEGRAWAEARIKALTGGDPITARFMRQDFFTYLPSFKLTVIGNHKPALANVDDAAKRRFNIVPFTRKPATPDRELETKLLTEAPGILQWMVQGCLDWQQHGLVRPNVVIDATAQYFSDQDAFQHWLDDGCECDPKAEATSSSLFESWTLFAKRNRVKPGTAASFKERMIGAGFVFYRTPQARKFFGVRLKPIDLNDAGPQMGA